MPGLLGVFKNNLEPSDLTIFRSMVKSLNHRAIYKNNILVGHNNSYAIASISLPFIKHEQEVFTNDDGSVILLMHGEIYNDDIVESDQLTYIYKLYHKFDLRFANHLNGSFVIFIIDNIKNRLIIVNDRTGSRPLFYSTDGRALYCAPELKALMLLPHIRKKLDVSAVASFLSCGYFLDGVIWVNDVKLLDNATILVFSKEDLKFKKYWSFEFTENPRDLGLRYYQEVLSELITKSVKDRIRTSHKYGILLSGGYDSRGILGCVLQTKDCGEIQSISWGEKEDIQDSDCIIAKRLAERLGVQHTFYKLIPSRLPDHIKDFIYLSDGMTDAYANYPESLKIFERIRDELDIEILLRGDECFGWLSTAFDEHTIFQSLGVCQLHRVHEFQSIIKPEKMTVLGDKISQMVNKISNKTSSSNIHNRKDFFYLDQRLKWYLNPLSYVKRIDIELRNPYIDNNIFDFMINMPAKYRISKNLYIKTIRDMFPEIFTEVAHKSNLIDWEWHLGNSEVLKEFLENEFSRNTDLLDDLIDWKMFKEYRLEKSKSAMKGLMDRTRSSLVDQYPGIYRVMKEIQSAVRRKTGKTNIFMPKAIVVQRILTMKIWCDLFLNGKTNQ